MDIVINFASKTWELFWSIWPKNFWFLVIGAALAEAVSVMVLRLSGNRGWLAVLGYVLGFLTVAFYAEAQKYSTLSVSYPIWLGLVAILVSVIAFLVFHDHLSIKWFIGFVLTIVGILLIQTSISE